MNPGETEQFCCMVCNRHFEVTLFPDAAGMTRDQQIRAGGYEPAKLTYCPFCAEEFPQNVTQR